MIDRVSFENYRAFGAGGKPFVVAPLTRVNLFVGKNNSGKTAIIEGIQLLLSGGDTAVIAEILQRRGEITVPIEEKETHAEIGHFFPNRDWLNSKLVSIEADPGHCFFEMNIRPVQVGEEADSKSRNLSFNFPFLLSTMADGKGNPPASVFGLHRDGIVRNQGFGTKGAHPASYLNCPAVPLYFLGTDGADYETMLALWDQASLNGQESSVLEALQLLNPNIDSFHFLSGIATVRKSFQKAGAVVGVAGQKQKVPLGSMGEGMKRMLALSLALANVQGGALFIDEIDTGLHYSVLSDMWRMVIQKAIDWDIQIFATTHSWDCLKGLAQLTSEDSDLAKEVTVHKLEIGFSHSIPFAGNSLRKMVVNEIDPR